MKQLLLSLLTVFLFFQGVSQAQNCFSIIAGKGATVDGSVLVAHNEDDFGDMIVNWYIANSKEGDKRNSEQADVAVALEHPFAVVAPEKPENLDRMVKGNLIKYLWLEMPGMHFSDSYMNEFGVVVCSNACGSREDKPELSEGGISWELRNSMATLGKSAREAIHIGARLIESRGYTGSGRTYIVADPKEAWMMSVVNGKHWVARRLGDNEVAVIPNYYTIKEVNLKDTMNYLGSADLITYAKNRGWYHPDINGKFNFREVYGDPSNLQHLENIGRKWAAVNLLAKEKVEMGNNFAWSFVPKKKLSPADLMKVLSNHYEGTDLDDTENYKLRNPHELKPHGVCASHNQYGFVAQLRSFMPAPIGNVMWLAPRRPCINAFTPWYIGITYIPEGYASRSFEEALNNHFEAPEKPCADGGNYIYCDYASFCEQMDKQYDRHIVSVRAKVEAFQKSLFEQQKAFEEKAMAVWKKDPQRAAIMLTRYTHQQSSSGVRLNAGIFEDGNQ